GTGHPACAATWTMPPPMRPQPMTPTFLMAMQPPEAVRWLGAGAATRQGPWLVVQVARRARVPHREGYGRRLGRAWRRARVAQRLVERRRGARGARLRHDAQEHRLVDRRLRLLGDDGRRPRGEPEQGQGGHEPPTHG